MLKLHDRMPRKRCECASIEAKTEEFFRKEGVVFELKAMESLSNMKMEIGFIGFGI